MIIFSPTSTRGFPQSQLRGGAHYPAAPVPGWIDDTTSGIRLALHQKDRQTYGGYRTELECPVYPAIGEFWYRVAFALDPTVWKNDGANARIITQHHTESSTLNPPINIRVDKDNKFKLQINPSSAGSLFRVAYQWPLALGISQDTLMRVSWRADNTGSFDFWLNGALAHSESNVMTQWEGVELVYQKIGIYRWAKMPSAIAQDAVFYTNVRTGDASSSYDEMMAQ